MTQEGLRFLTYDKVRQVIEENLEKDSAQFALANFDNEIPIALVSTQLKYLKKSKKKLPSWYEARCIIPPLAYEQASSEATASLKKFEGNRCLDMSCGLGVDSFYLAKHFHSVIGLEMNTVLAQIVRYNFELMGVQNIEVRNQKAQDFLNDYQGPEFDLIYIDPARRDENGVRTYDLNDQSPNVLKLLPQLLSLGKKIVIKTSPLFDIAEAFRQFPIACKVSVLSVNNECKEVLIELTGLRSPSINSPTTPLLEIICTREDAPESARHFCFSYPLPYINWQAADHLESYLYEADVAFYKARCFVHLMNEYFSDFPGHMNSESGFFFSNEYLIDDFPGRKFHLIQSFPYKPKKLKSWLADYGVSRVNLMKKHFPFAISDIRKQLKMPEGGEEYLIFTSIREQKYALLARLITHKPDAHPPIADTD